jgi:hypothetical protein
MRRQKRLKCFRLTIFVPNAKAAAGGNNMARGTCVSDVWARGNISRAKSFGSEGRARCAAEPGPFMTAGKGTLVHPRIAPG